MLRGTGQSPQVLASVWAGSSETTFWVWLGGGLVTWGHCDREMTTQPCRVVCLPNIALYELVPTTLICTALPKITLIRTALPKIQCPVQRRLGWTRASKNSLYSLEYRMFCYNEEAYRFYCLHIHCLVTNFECSLFASVPGNHLILINNLILHLHTLLYDKSSFRLL